MNKKELAAKLRALARDYEVRADSVLRFTCNKVTHDIGCGAGYVYARLFGFHSDHTGNDTPNAQELWDSPARVRQDLRVLMLCFAAAMAETGDL
jgi:hypothetical protein